jgi:hypothetical protein
MSNLLVKPESHLGPHGKTFLNKRHRSLTPALAGLAADVGKRAPYDLWMSLYRSGCVQSKKRDSRDREFLSCRMALK